MRLFSLFLSGLIFSICSCKSRSIASSALADAEIKSHSTAFFLKKEDILDLQLSMFGGHKIPQAAIDELDTRLSEFQDSWDNAVKQGLLDLSTNLSKRSFERKEYIIWASLAPLIPMGRPLIINMNPYLRNGTKAGSTLSDLAFVSMTHHEVLHFLVENIEGPILFRVSSIAQKYEKEPQNVLVHLHLMALQKATYLKMGDIGKMLMIETDNLYNSIIKGDYQRAWQIVEIEGYQKFLDELTALNLK